MSAQFDYISGVDISGLSSVTQTQIMQLVNQIAPINNIGGIIWMSGAANAHPDVTNNPRFIRYLWIDTQTSGNPVAKLYKGTYPSDAYSDWEAIGIPDAAITAAKIADYAVTILNGSGANKMAYKPDASINLSKAGYLLRLDANGQYVEVVTPSTVFSALTIALSQIPPGSASQVLATSPTTGLPAWTTLSSLITVASDSLALTTLQYGADPGYLLRRSTVAVGGEYPVEEVTNSDKEATGGLFPDNSIFLKRLWDASAADGDTVRYDAGTGFWSRKPYKKSGALAIPDRTTGGIITYAHNLGAVPRNIGGYIQNISGGSLLGYADDDIVDIKCIIQSGNGGELRQGTFLGSDANNVFCTFILDGGAGAGQGYRIANKGTYALTGVLDPAQWEVYLWAEL